MKETLEIVFRNKKDELYSAYFPVSDHPVGKKWFQFLSKTLSSPHYFEKNYTFLGFLHSEKNLASLIQNTQSVCRKISSYVGEGPWKYGYSISEQFDHPDTFKNTISSLRRHFEVLMGQSWSVSPYYSCANEELRTTIHQLNYLICQIDALLHSQQQFAETGSYYPYMIVSFPQCSLKPVQLEQDDYHFFSLNRPFGCLTLHYAQTGKSHFDAFRDQEEIKGNSQIQGLRYLSGQFDVNWGDGPDLSESRLRTFYSGFFHWLERQGYATDNIHFFQDEKDQKQGIGFIEVARLREDQRSKGIAYWQELLGEYNDIFALRLHGAEGIVEKSYPKRAESSIE